MVRRRIPGLPALGLVQLLAMLHPMPAAAQGRFSDVPPGHWAYEAVNELAARGILRGYPAPAHGESPARKPSTAGGRPTRLPSRRLGSPAGATGPRRAGHHARSGAR